MKSRYFLTAIMVAVCLGCSKSDSGDVETAKKAAEAAPKSVDQLPSNMPPEAKAAAAGAMAQAQAQMQQNNDPARIHAMQMMQSQKH